ncbi:hypothetical protein AB0885_41820, partial [Streptomyces sp. NPDC005534]
MWRVNGHADGPGYETLPTGVKPAPARPQTAATYSAQASRTRPTTSVSSGAYTFRYRVTAQHKGTFK